MKIICLNDKYKPQDRVSHGKVKCFDQSGNKVFDNSNMIVATGRSAIRKQCFDYILFDKKSNANRCKIYVGNNGTTPTDYGMGFSETGYEKIGDSNNTIAVIGAPPVFTTIKSTVKTTDNKDKIINLLVKDGQVTEYEDNAENRALLKDPDNPDFVRTVITIPARDTDQKEISDLCIVQSDGKLFSRVCFDQIRLDNNNGYTLIYFIYF